MQAAKIESIHVGMPRSMPRSMLVDKPWESGFLKESMTEPLWLGTTNLEGDGQADLAHHGGPHKAVCVYPAVHYPYWRNQLRMPDLLGGDFGENFTISGLTEHDVCVGDIWSIGEATVQVSQPRQPCWKLARRWDIKDLAYQVQQTGFTGWYFRVLTEGYVQRGMKIELDERRWGEWTVAVANQIMHHDQHNRESAAKLAAVPTLSPSWHATLTKRAERGIQPDEATRLGDPGALP